MDRPLIRLSQLAIEGLTPSKLRWAQKKGRAHRVANGLYVLGSQPPTKFELAVGRTVAGGNVVMGELAALLYDLEVQGSFNLGAIAARADHSQGRRVNVQPRDVRELNGLPITSPERTLIELAGRYSDDRFEQMLESALRMKLTTTKALLDRVNLAKHHGNARVRRVLAERGMDTLPTDSLLETLAVQLFREDPTIPEPVRQQELRSKTGDFLGRVDLAFPEFRTFVELDGAWHKDQEGYDANRQTRISAHTGWVAARFTWDDITKTPRHTLRLMKSLLRQQAA